VLDKDLSSTQGEVVFQKDIKQFESKLPVYKVKKVQLQNPPVREKKLSQANSSGSGQLNSSGSSKG